MNRVALAQATAAIEELLRLYPRLYPISSCTPVYSGAIGWGASPQELAKAALDAALYEIERDAVERAANRIRAEWVCGCVEEHPDEPDKWDECCKYSEWAARNALDSLTK